jgi:hypothetical protein
MAKDSDRPRGGSDIGETGGALSGLLAEEDEFDRRALWRLGTWAAVSIGAVIVALITNQSSIGMRHEQTASADLLKQAQQLQLTSRESQNETRRLASAVDTLNSDRDRLYSRVTVLEQGLDSVTGSIARQSSAASPQANSNQANPGQASASPTAANQPSANQAGPTQANVNAAAPTGPAVGPPAPAPPPVVASTAPPAAPSVDPSPPAAKLPAPVVGPVAATVPTALEKQDKEKQDKPDKQASKQPSAPPSVEPGPTVVASLSIQPPAAAPQPSGSLVASKSMMGPPDPAAGKLIEPAASPKAVTAAPAPEVAAIAPKVSHESEPGPAPASLELAVQRTEFGVDVGGANSISGLRALWRGLSKSKANAALTKLRPIIVIKEGSNGLGMQLRLVAGPISDAAAAAKLCASLMVSDRSCSTAVFEGQRLAVSDDEADKADTGKTVEADSKPVVAASRYYSTHRHYYGAKHPKTEDSPPPKPEPSTLSQIFGRR